MNTPAFEFNGLTLALEVLQPIRQVRPADAAFGKYRTILTSLREVGLIEPLIVFPEQGTGRYFVLDGHLRLKALQELGRTSAFCLLARDTDVLTYNDKVNRLSVIQEHAMILRAMEQGVTSEQVAQALDLDPSQLKRKVALLHGIGDAAVNLLKDRPITAGTLGLLRRVTPARQREMAQLMVASNNFTRAYVQALLIGTPREQLVGPKPTQLARGLSADELARMEKEMEHLEHDLRSHQDRFGENALRLSAAQRYLKRLLGKARIQRFLAQRHPEILEEFQTVLALDAI